MPRDYHELPDEAHTPSAEPLAADFCFNDSEPPPEADFTGTGGLPRRDGRAEFRPHYPFT